MVSGRAAVPAACAGGRAEHGTPVSAGVRTEARGREVTSAALGVRVLQQGKRRAARRPDRGAVQEGGRCCSFTLGIVDGRRDAVAKRCCDEDEDVIAVRLGVGGEQLLRATQGQLRLGRGEVASSSSFFPSLLCVVWRRWRGSTPGRISQGWARSQWG